MKLEGIGIILIIVIAYLPIIYNFQRRLRKLEDEVNNLKKQR